MKPATKSGRTTRRCPSCRELCLVAQGDRGELLVDREPAPAGRIVFQTAHTKDGQPLGARRAHFIGEGETPKPGTTRWTPHKWTCRARKRRARSADEQRELWQPCKEA